ncbi:MAG: hypothetical protein Q4A89_00600 [Tannerella sp.]|nr:hypothetical protein [Tannerella sp.]
MADKSSAFSLNRQINIRSISRERPNHNDRTARMHLFRWDQSGTLVRIREWNLDQSQRKAGHLYSGKKHYLCGSLYATNDEKNNITFSLRMDYAADGVC